MILFRALAFLCFILLLAGMGVWQFDHIARALADAPGMPGLAFVLAGAPILLAVTWFIDAKLRGNARMIAFGVAGLPVLPATALIAGALHAIMGGGHGRRIWTVGLTVGGLIGFNIAVALLGALLVADGAAGLALGVTTIKLEFFLVADYFLCRSVVHYFTSGASAFVSLRYLRRRVISLLSVIGIAMGVFVLILVNSVMTGFQTDFREQVRGSLSHLLVRFDSGRLHPSMMVKDELEWAEYVRRLESDDKLKPVWNTLLADAIKRYRDDTREGKQLADEIDGPEADPAGPQPADASEKSLLKRLRTGRGVIAKVQEYLRQGGELTTPRGVYLYGKAPANEREREALDAEIREGWFYPVFRKQMMEEFARAERVLRAHKDAQGQSDIQGVSWRVFSKTFIAPKYVTADLPIAELVGVDVSHETEISELGQYVAAAEVESFKRRYVQAPLQQMLGATLGFETAESSKDFGPVAFNYTAQGKGDSYPRDMARQLKLRRLTSSADKVMWNEFDAIRFWPQTPGKRLYERAKAAYKAAGRTEDLPGLRKIVAEAERDLRAIIDAELAKAPPATEEEAGGRVGCMYIRDWILTGTGASDAMMRRLVREYHDRLAEISKETDVPEEQAKWVGALSLKFRDATEAARAEITDPKADEVKREEALRKLVETYSALVNGALKETEEKGWEVHFKLKDNLDTRLDPVEQLPYSPRAFLPRPMPLSYAAAFFDKRAGTVAARQDAYRKVLPLRTSMGDTETAADYLARATKEGERPLDGSAPGVILGDALAESALLGGVQVGDTIALTIPRIYRDEDGRLVPKAIEARFVVTAFFHSGLYEDNFGRIYCDFDELAKLLADSETRYTVGARFKDYSPYEGDNGSAKLKKEISDTLRRERVNFVSVGVWEDEKRSLLEAVNREKAIIGLIVAFILFLAGVLIIIVVYQLVSEKIKDIGILKALGHSPWGIRSVFMFNALFIGLFGAAIGCAMGIAGSEYLNVIEDFVDQLTGIRLFPPEIYYLTYIPSLKGRDLYMLALDIAVPAVLWSFGCGILPALAAARKDPIEALHNE
ncbi:MAG: FtsX-like permease family protein [Planctomycetes bacterium]|nr:FtsX-like permease family protein [Planctomycetota bacterium]